MEEKETNIRISEKQETKLNNKVGNDEVMIKYMTEVRKGKFRMRKNEVKKRKGQESKKNKRIIPKTRASVELPL